MSGRDRWTVGAMLCAALGIGLAGAMPASAQEMDESEPAAQEKSAKSKAKDKVQDKSAEGEWLTDFEAAKAKAAKEKKHLLIDFTGSDWCGWCIRLKKEVFTKSEFKEAAPKQFILVELDFPNSVPQSDELKEQNEALRDKYSVQGYPTIILAKADGSEIARTGYQAGGPDKYLKHLDELLEKGAKIDAAFEKAKKAKGIEKAKLLDEALTAAKDMGRDADEDVMKEIIGLDEDGKAGLKKKYEAVLAKGELEQKLNELMSDSKIDEALAAIDSHVKKYELTGSALQETLTIKFQVLMAKAQSTNSRSTGMKALAVLNEAVEAAPETDMAQQIKSALGRIEQQIKRLPDDEEKSKGEGEGDDAMEGKSDDETPAKTEKP